MNVELMECFLIKKQFIFDLKRNFLSDHQFYLALAQPQEWLTRIPIAKALIFEASPGNPELVAAPRLGRRLVVTDVASAS